jgi:hypothetical protein
LLASNTVLRCVRTYAIEHVALSEMDSLIYKDSPLAELLEGARRHPTFPPREIFHPLLLPRMSSRLGSLDLRILGEGTAEAEWISSERLPPPDPPDSVLQSFAPQGPSTLHSRIRDRLPHPLRIPLHRQGPVARIHSACSVSTLRNPIVVSVPGKASLLMHG